MVAVFFFDGHALLPEYHELGSGDPADALVTLIERGPDEALSNFVVEASFVAASEREGLEQISLELSDEFWERPPGEVYAAAAQIVFTLATLEEGKEVLLLDGTVPGEVLDGSFEPIDQPLARSDFADVRPWVEVAQPVAGSTVGSVFPVSLALREGRATVTLSSDNGPDSTLTMRKGTALITTEAERGPAELAVVVTDRAGTDHTVRVPLILVPQSAPSS